MLHWAGPLEAIGSAGSHTINTLEVLTVVRFAFPQPEIDPAATQPVATAACLRNSLRLGQCLFIASIHSSESGLQDDHFMIEHRLDFELYPTILGSSSPILLGNQHLERLRPDAPRHTNFHLEGADRDQLVHGSCARSRRW